MLCWTLQSFVYSIEKVVSYAAMILGATMVKKRVMSVDRCPADLQCQVGKS